MSTEAMSTISSGSEKPCESGERHEQHGWIEMEGTGTGRLGYREVEWTCPGVGVCENCGKTERAQIFLGAPWCSDNCRKIIQAADPEPISQDQVIARLQDWALKEQESKEQAWVQRDVLREENALLKAFLGYSITTPEGRLALSESGVPTSNITMFTISGVDRFHEDFTLTHERTRDPWGWRVKVTPK